MRLSGAQQQQLTKRPTESAEAYELYLKGRHIFNNFTRESFPKSRASFQRAIELDPGFALAYVGIALSYNMETLYRGAPPHQLVPKAKAAVARALQLDERLSEAHTWPGWIAFAYDRDWAEAEEALRYAAELNPNNAPAHNFYGGYLTIQGRFDEALAKRAKALQLDPLSGPIRGTRCWTLYFARRYDSAIEECGQALELEENHYRAHLYRGIAYEQKGMAEQALAELEKARGADMSRPEILSAIAHLHASSGSVAEARRILGMLLEPSRSDYVDPYAVPLIYAGLRDHHGVFEWLENAYEAKSIMLSWLAIEPRWDGIRSDPRYADFARRVGFAGAVSVIIERRESSH